MLYKNLKAEFKSKVRQVNPSPLLGKVVEQIDHF